MEKQGSSTSEADDDISSSIKYERKATGRKTLDNHCEIERKRREKMLSYIFELRDSIPACQSLQCSKNKPDKITILRMAADHLKTLEGTGNLTQAKNITSFLSHQELKHLILEAANGFLFIVNCNFGCIMYVTDSIKSVLNYNPSDWIGSCIYDMVHFGDVDHLKQQLSTQETQKPQVVLDLKSGSMKKEKHPNEKCKRNFICRMKINHNDRKQRNIFLPSLDGQNYVVVHCSGYVKKLPTENKNLRDIRFSENLIAIGRLQVSSIPETTDLSNHKEEFISRHTLDGTFSFVDQRVVDILGYAPKDLLGKNCYDFFHPGEKSYLQESFKQVIALKGQLMNVVGRFKAKNYEWILLKISMYAFANPWSDEIEFIMCTNTIANNYGENKEDSITSIDSQQQQITINYEQHSHDKNRTDYSKIVRNLQQPTLTYDPQSSNLSENQISIDNPIVPSNQNHQRSCSFSNAHSIEANQLCHNQNELSSYQPSCSSMQNSTEMSSSQTIWNLEIPFADCSLTPTPCLEEALAANKIQCDNYDKVEDFEDLLDLLNQHDNPGLDSLDSLKHLFK